MYKSVYQPGARVEADMGWYHHQAIVSEKWYQGKPMLISHTKRNGTVKEEPWDKVFQGKWANLCEDQGNLHPRVVLRRARSKIGRLTYDVFSQNCEHFTNWAHGLKVESKQVKAGMTGLGIGFVIALLILGKLKK